jgi:hypothetical protein
MAQESFIWDSATIYSMIYIQRSISIPRGEPKIVKTRQFKQYNTNNFKADIFTHLIKR